MFGEKRLRKAGFVGLNAIICAIAITVAVFACFALTKSNRLLNSPEVESQETEGLTMHCISLWAAIFNGIASTILAGYGVFVVFKMLNATTNCLFVFFIVVLGVLQATVLIMHCVSVVKIEQGLDNYGQNYSSNETNGEIKLPCCESLRPQWCDGDKSAYAVGETGMDSEITHIEMPSGDQTDQLECAHAIVRWLTNTAWHIGVGLACLIGLEAISAVFACYLRRDSRMSGAYKI